MRTSILLIGAEGYIGKKLATAFFNEKWDTKCLQRNNLLTELARNRESYDFVVNAAGYTGKPNVDDCKHNKQRVLEDNVLLPTLLTEWCKRWEVPLVHVSSGCIYSGSAGGGTGFTEEHEPNYSFLSEEPCSYYSGSKAAAETIVRGYDKHHILRLRMPFNGERSDRNLLVKLLNYRLLVDVTNSITHVDDFIASTVMIMKDSLPYGTWNLVNHSPVTTRTICEVLSRYGHSNKFQFFKRYEDFMKTVEEPRSSCVLSNEKALDYGLPMRHSLVALADACRKLKPEPMAVF